MFDERTFEARIAFCVAQERALDELRKGLIFGGPAGDDGAVPRCADDVLRWLDAQLDGRWGHEISAPGVYLEMPCDAAFVVLSKFGFIDVRPGVAIALHGLDDASIHYHGKQEGL